MIWFIANWQMVLGILGWGLSTVAVVGSIWWVSVRVSNKIGIYIGTANTRLDGLEFRVGAVSAEMKTLSTDVKIGFRDANQRMNDHFNNTLPEPARAGSHGGD